MPIRQTNTTITAEEARNRTTEYARSKKEDPKYAAEYKKFIGWLQENGKSADGQGNWITRDNVDDYFSIQVATNRNGQKNTLKTIIYALRWYSKYREHVGENFVVDSPLTEHGIEISLERQMQSIPGESENPKSVPDPHIGLKDVLPEEDREAVMDEIYKNRKNDWGETAVSFCWGNQACVRGDTTRKLELSDLGFSRGFGPERRGPRAGAVSMILRRGEKNKERRDTDQQVFCWRHRNYKLCSNFSLALHVIWVLNKMDVSFFRPDKTKRADWWDIPLIDWTKYNEASAAMKAIYKKCGIRTNSKITHDRAHAIQFGGGEGLAPYQMHTLSKHMTEKYFKSYQSEADKEACKVMAGFSKDEPWHCGRFHITKPYTLQQYEEFLLPQLSEWRQQVASDAGDKSICADKFLNDILPFLVMVLVEDAIYFVKDFPDHPAALLVKERIPDYTTWAVHARSQAKNIQENRGLDVARALNGAAQGALESCQRRIDAFETTLMQMAQGIETLLAWIQQVETTGAATGDPPGTTPLRATRNATTTTRNATTDAAATNTTTPPARTTNTTTPPARTRTTPPATTRNSTATTTTRNPNTTRRFAARTSTVTPTNNSQIPNAGLTMEVAFALAPNNDGLRRLAAQTRGSLQANGARRQLTNALRPSNHPRRDVFVSKMEKSFVDLASSWYNLGWATVIYTSLNNAQKCAYTKKKRLMTDIEHQKQYVRGPNGSAFNGTDYERTIEAAKFMDGKRRRNESLSGYYRRTFTNNPDAMIDRRGPRLAGRRRERAAPTPPDELPGPTRQRRERNYTAQQYSVQEEEVARTSRGTAAARESRHRIETQRRRLLNHRMNREIDQAIELARQEFQSTIPRTADILDDDHMLRWCAIRNRIRQRIKDKYTDTT